MFLFHSLRKLIFISIFTYAFVFKPIASGYNPMLMFKLIAIVSLFLKSFVFRSLQNVIF